MNYTLLNDIKTGRQYYQLENPSMVSELVNRVDFDNIILASYNNTTRFLLNDATLVIVKTNDYLAIYQSLISYAPSKLIKEIQRNSFDVVLGEHAIVRISCATCDNGNSHDYTYSLHDKVQKLSSYDYYIHDFDNWMVLHLNNYQSTKVLEGATSIYNASELGLYKYIDHWQNCMSVPFNIYRNSGLPHHISHFYMDTELLEDQLSAYVLKDRLYRPDNLIDPQRSEVSFFMKDVYGPDYAKNWHNGHSPIASQEVDLKKAMLNPAIKTRIEELKVFREEIYDEFIKIWDTNNSITSEHIKPFTEHAFTNEELYYTYTIKFELEAHKLLMPLPYAQQLYLIPFGMNIAEICLTSKNTIYDPVCKEFCNKENYFSTNIYILEACERFQENGTCQIPYPPIYLDGCNKLMGSNISFCDELLSEYLVENGMCQT